MYIHAHEGLPIRMIRLIDRRLATSGRLIHLGNRRGSDRLRDGRLLGGGGLPNRIRRGTRRGQQTQTQRMHFFGHKYAF